MEVTLLRTISASPGGSFQIPCSTDARIWCLLMCFIKADKGNMTVIMKKQDYDEKLVKMLSNDETYENLKRDPTAKTEKLFNKFISTLLDNQKNYTR